MILPRDTPISCSASMVHTATFVHSTFFGSIGHCISYFHITPIILFGQYGTGIIVGQFVQT
jgi:hypothetical protein